MVRLSSNLGASQGQPPPSAGPRRGLAVGGGQAFSLVERARGVLLCVGSRMPLHSIGLRAYRHIRRAVLRGLHVAGKRKGKAPPGTLAGRVHPAGRHTWPHAKHPQTCMC